MENSNLKWWITKNEAGNREELDLNFRGSLAEAQAEAKRLFSEAFGQEPTFENERIMRCERGFIKIFGPISDDPSIIYMHVTPKQ